MMNLNANIEHYLKQLVNEAVNNSIQKTAEATAKLLNQTPLQKDPDELLTPKEATDVLKCSITTLWRYENSGKVKSYTIGGKRLYKRSDLLESLNK